MRCPSCLAKFPGELALSDEEVIEEPFEKKDVIRYEDEDEDLED